MKKADILERRAYKYTEEKLGEKKVISSLMFRIYKEKYYAGFIVFDLVNPEKGDIRIKRPTNWLLLDIDTAELKGFYDIEDYDFTNDTILPLDKTFINEGLIQINECSNFIMGSYMDWKKELISQLEEKSVYNQNEKIFLIKDNLISINDFTDLEIKPVLDELQRKLFNKILDMNRGIIRYYYYLTDKIIDTYMKTNKINLDDNNQYIKLLKYQWPHQSELIDCFNNII